MKKNYSLIFLAFLCSLSFCFGQYNVNFEDDSKAGYASGTVTLNGIDWNMTEALIGNQANDWKNGLNSARLRGYGTSAITMLQDKANGIGTISFDYRRYGTDSQVDWRVEYSTNSGSSWNQAGSSFTAPSNNTVQTFSATVNVTGPVRIRILRETISGSSNRRLNIDDISITDYTVSTDPNLSITGTTNHGSTCVGSAATTIQYTITNSGTLPAAGINV